MGEALAAAGQQLALSVDPDWNDAAWSALVQLAQTRQPFTADHVRFKVGSPPTLGAMGAVFREASVRGLIAVAGYRSASRIQRHGSLVRSWKGTERGRFA